MEETAKKEREKIRLERQKLMDIRKQRESYIRAVENNMKLVKEVINLYCITQYTRVDRVQPHFFCLSARAMGRAATTVVQLHSNRSQADDLLSTQSAQRQNDRIIDEMSNRVEK